MPTKLWLNRSASLRAKASTCCARGVKLFKFSSLMVNQGADAAPNARTVHPVEWTVNLVSTYQEKRRASHTEPAWRAAAHLALEFARVERFAREFLLALSGVSPIAWPVAVPMASASGSLPFSIFSFSLLGACIETMSFDLVTTPGASKRGD